ncbi:hypothetical protein AGMMS49965_13660 [Bacteroidia bacterium]|nr:hypothetical protein AGMMS49965_13660 [Bacteroidia bacterium]
MNNTQLIALQKVLTKGGVTALYATCKYGLGRFPENPKDLLKIIEILRGEGIFDYEVTLAQLNRAMDDAERIVEESAEQGIGIVSYFDERFPEALKHFTKNGKQAYPLILYYKGNLKSAAEMYAIAVIGTRHPTEDGVRMAYHYGNYFSAQGFNIVSGLAVGCDAVAHIGALDAKGMTTAFVAHGLDIVPRQTEVAERIIASGGAIVSEYPVGTPVGYQNLVERNRLQAGLSDAVILVQSDWKKGGSMHAVNVAIENKKPVFAVKFATEEANSHPMSQGNMQLLKEKKARMLTPDNVKEVIDAVDNSDDIKE